MAGFPRAFIGHAHEDKALELAALLRASGVDAWIDEWEISAGDSLVDKIYERGLKGCDVFVVLLSPASLTSRWVRDELDAAVVRRIEGQTRTISVRVETCEIPEALRAYRWLELAGWSAEGCQGDRRRGVQAIIGPARDPAEQGVNARRARLVAGCDAGWERSRAGATSSQRLNSPTSSRNAWTTIRTTMHPLSRRRWPPAVPLTGRRWPGRPASLQLVQIVQSTSWRIGALLTHCARLAQGLTRSYKRPRIARRDG